MQQQIAIDVKLIELNESATKRLGVDLKIAQGLAQIPPHDSVSGPTGAAGLGPTPSAEAIAGLLSPAGAAGALKVSGVVTAPQLQAIVSNLNGEAVANMMSVPTLIIPDAQRAYIQVPSFTSGGVRLEVQPNIGPDGTSVVLNLTPKVEDSPGPASNTKTKLGETLLLAGTLPIHDQQEHHLILLVTPHVVNVLIRSVDMAGGPDKLKVEARGTGNTVGHVADLQIRNLTDQPLNFIVPALLVESKTGRNQDYACPGQQDVALTPNQTQTVPLDGVCVNRDKPPVGKGATTELVLNTGDPRVEKYPDCHTSGKEARELLRLTEAKYHCADNLQKNGELKDFPYSDKQKQRDILLQWSTWTDPRVCQIAKSTPATKQDLQQVVYKQAPKTPSRETKKKLEDGIDNIFDKVELTNEKAKELEHPDPFSNVELTGTKAKDEGAKSPSSALPPAGVTPTQPP